MSFLRLPTELHTALLLEWLPFYKEYSALDIALSKRSYWLELLRSPALQVDPPLPITPHASYYTWLHSRKLQVVTLKVSMIAMPCIKSMRFPSVEKVEVVFPGKAIQHISSLAHFLKENPNITHVAVLETALRLSQAHLMALAKHRLDLKVLDLLGSDIETSDHAVAGGIFALLYNFGHSLEELRLSFACKDRCHDYMKDDAPHVLHAIGQRCPHLRRLQLSGFTASCESIHSLCEENANLTELRCYTHFKSAAEADSACETILQSLPALEHLSLVSFVTSNPTSLPDLANYPQLQSIVTDEAEVDLMKKTLEIRKWSVPPVKVMEIVMSMPFAMRSIVLQGQEITGADVLQMAEKHGANLESIECSLARNAMTTDKWQQLWTLCPHLKAIKNRNMTLLLDVGSFEHNGNQQSTQETLDILLTVPVPLQTILIDKCNPIPLAPSDILAIAAKHGPTLQNFGVGLNVAELGHGGLRQFFELCPVLNQVDLKDADEDSMLFVTTECTKITALCVSGDQVSDEHIIALLQKQQLTSLTLIDCVSVTPAVLDHIGNLTTLGIAGDSSISADDIVKALESGKLSTLTNLYLDFDRVQMLFIKTVLQLAEHNNPRIGTCDISGANDVSDSESDPELDAKDDDSDEESSSEV